MMSSVAETTPPTAFCPKWDATTIPPESRELLEKYSGIPQDQVNQHVEELVRRPNNKTSYIH